MNVSDALVRALHGQKDMQRQCRFGFVPAPTGGPYDAEAFADGVSVAVHAIDTGRYGLRMSRLHLHADGEMDTHGILDAITAGVVTPYGPFLAAEGDGDSARTHAVGEAGSYYEVRVDNAGEVVVTHHAQAPGRDEPQATPVDIGLDMFRIMVVDLVEALRRALIPSV
jgi:hypothetical protein